MNDPTSNKDSHSRKRRSRRPIHGRLRPFLRRDLRPRVLSALAAVVILTGLAWLGISALTGMDSITAHELRVQAGLESPHAVCGLAGPSCTYDDREQAEIDGQFYLERSIRLAVLDELGVRIAFALDRLGEAEDELATLPVDRRTGGIAADTTHLRGLLEQAAIDLRPASSAAAFDELLGHWTDEVIRSAAARRAGLTWPLEIVVPGCDTHFDGLGWVRHCDIEEVTGLPALTNDEDGDGPDLVAHEALTAEIAKQRLELRAVEARIDRLRRRDRASAPGPLLRERLAIVEGPLHSDDALGVQAATPLVNWLAVPVPTSQDVLGPADLLDSSSSPYWAPTVGETRRASDDLPEIPAAIASLVRTNPNELAEAAFDPTAAIWHDGWRGASSTIDKPSIRYRSPITDKQRWQLLGAALLTLASIMLLVVGPVVTATTTAREREAGTLPVLRMTGLSPGDLAAAMAIGPNAFALVAGGLLLATAIPILALCVGPQALAMPLALLALLAVTTHLTAVGLGDALGQRVNAMVVGGLAALAIVGCGVVGAVVVVGDLAATGLLLGPLPAVLAASLETSGVPTLMASAQSGMEKTMLGYAVITQALLGVICLASWRRRVERPWAPLFHPIEGVALALASMGCSALAILDLSDRTHVQTYDSANLITFVATGFLMPVLAWLLVASLRRPARAAAVTACSEARRAFWRFQGLALLTAAAVGGAYYLVMQRTGLGNEESEVMWATLTQWALVAETAVATLLWAARKREGRHRVVMLGAAVVALQIAFAVGVYGLEVEHVAIHHDAALPLLLGMDVSSYWIVFLILLWAAGLGLMLAALLRDRDRARAEKEAEDKAEEEGQDDEDQDDDNGQPRHWLH